MQIIGQPHRAGLKAGLRNDANETTFSGIVS